MKILLIGNKQDWEEARLKFGGQHEYQFTDAHSAASKVIGSCEVVFDFIPESSQMGLYETTSSIVFLNTVQSTLASVTANVEGGVYFGFCGMRTFLNRELMEITVRQKEDVKLLLEVCEKLQTRFHIVADHTGMVTPRVICMIINEAYLTVEEGTATREDIDLAMKLGTGYPYGPFEWAKRIGLEEVCALLEATGKDTKDERYHVSALLKNDAIATSKR